MRYRPLSDTGLEVSELSFGAMTFGAGMGPISRVLDAATCAPHLDPQSVYDSFPEN